MNNSKETELLERLLRHQPLETEHLGEQFQATYIQLRHILGEPDEQSVFSNDTVRAQRIEKILERMDDIFKSVPKPPLSLTSNLAYSLARAEVGDALKLLISNTPLELIDEAIVMKAQDALASPAQGDEPVVHYGDCYAGNCEQCKKSVGNVSNEVKTMNGENKCQD